MKLIAFRGIYPAIIGICVGVPLAGCDHVFYQPMREIVATPGRLGVEYGEFPALAPDGQRVAAWWLKASGQPRGVIVQFHGNGENRSTHMYSVAWLTQENYHVVTFDYRGYGDSEGIPGREQAVEDGEAILRQVLSDPRAEKLPVFVVGQSLGGAVAIPAIVRAQTHPGAARIRGLALDSTFDSYRSVAGNKFASIWLLWPFQWVPYLLVSDQLAPRDFADRIKMPVLAFHAVHDRVVPFENGKALYGALASQDKEFVVVGGSSHTGAFFVEDGIYRTKWLDFMTKHQK